ncbi:lipoprotein [Hydrogenophaga sp.]|uniref:LPS translocon maturation chaperone LptM n=1 Tax=Hydrogenophaga sp. TaxID=1904254 RepID=UPI00344778D7
MNRRCASQILGAAPPSVGSLLRAALLVTGLLLVACGQKGPLFLPPSSTAKTATPAPPPASAEAADATLPVKSTR